MPQSSHTSDRVTPGSVARAAFIALPVPILQAVIDRKISRDAGWLYACLIYHYDRKRGDSIVTTTRDELARDMGISKTSNVDLHLKRLEEAGFILIFHERINRMKVRNKYKLLYLHDAPRSPASGTTERPAETRKTPTAATTEGTP